MEALPSSGIETAITCSSHKFTELIKSLKLEGGGGESNSLLADAMCTALDIFDSLAMDKDPNCVVTKYCIIVGSFVPYPMKCTESHNYYNMTVEELATKMGQVQ